MDRKNVEHRRVSEGTAVETMAGIHRTTLCYDAQVMLCHFVFDKGSAIPMHNHAAVQTGYVIRGSVRFSKKDGTSFIAGAGTGYIFDSEEHHAAEALEESELVECFAPMRPEYGDA